MHLLILGGTGPSGVLLIREALSANHTVIVYARGPQKLPDDIASHNSVTVIKGELEDIETLSQAIAAAEAVLSALGPTGPRHPRGTPLAKAYAAVIAEMKKHGVKRLIALGTASIKDDHDKFSVVYTAMVSSVALLAPTAYEDIVAVGHTIRTQGHGIDWTIARVPLLSNGDDRNVLAGYIGDGKTGATLARTGFAAFVIGELTEPQWVNKAPQLSARPWLPAC